MTNTKRTTVTDVARRRILVVCLAIAAALLSIAWVRPGSSSRSILHERVARSNTLHRQRTGTFDPGWQPISAPDTEPRRMTQACAYDPVHDMAYMYGGLSAGFENLTLCQRYAPNRDSWTDVAPMTSERGWLKGIYCRGKLYAIGGLSTDGRVLDSCEAYDIATNNWYPIASLPEANAAYQAVVWRDSLIYVFGGVGAHMAGTDSVRVYNPGTNTWTAGTSMPTPCDMGDACVIGDTVYFAGGLNRQTSALDTQMRIGAISPADPVQIAWSSGIRLPSPRFNGPVLALDGKVYWFGGFMSGSGQKTDKGYVYTPGTGAIDTLPTYPTTVVRCCFATERTASHEILGLAGQLGDTALGGYYRLGEPVTNDVGVTRIDAPSEDVDSGDTVTPTAVVRNYGNRAQGFQVVMRLDSFYTGLESTFVEANDTALVRFAPWAALRRGQHVARCSTMLAGDSAHGNDALSAQFMVHAIDAVVVAETLPHDTVAPGPQRLSITLHNNGTDGATFWMYLEFLRGDTALVYRDSISGYVNANHERQFIFAPWNATPGGYLGRYVVRLDRHVIRDTVTWHFSVYGTAVDEDVSGQVRPGEIGLEGPWPNPLRTRAVVHYDLPREAGISLVLYDAGGRQRAVLAEGLQPAGRHSLTIDTRHAALEVSPGVYFIRLEVAGRAGSGRPTVITHRALVLP